ncbi:gdsl esterase/lipase [Quercus suber]|uniref:Gdsl esterase/lipase n=1 Tax=Quercus suber TaxID=58331 RepID=A0AAW0L6K1_QUESU
MWAHGRLVIAQSEVYKFLTHREDFANVDEQPHEKAKAMKSYYIAALVVFFFNWCYIGKAANGQGSGASFIFGDSLGTITIYQRCLRQISNLMELISKHQEEILPAGDELGQPNYAVPFLAPNSTGKAILHGVNYASGGGGIMNATGRIFVNRLGLDVQIDYFNITRKQIDSLLGPSKARDFLMKTSIFSVSIGANDFLNNYLLPVLSIGARLSESPDAFIADMITHFRGQLTRLYQLDARKFVIGNVGPIGCIPYQKTINQLNEDECVELPNKLALQYNAKLKDLLTELNENLPGSFFFFFFPKNETNESINKRIENLQRVEY